MLTYKQQKILIEIYKSKEPLTFKDQKIFKNRMAFWRSMKLLIERGFVSKKLIRKNGRFINAYLVTLDGAMLSEYLKRFNDG